jgi:hypothetical protein
MKHSIKKGEGVIISQKISASLSGILSRELRAAERIVLFLCTEGGDSRSESLADELEGDLAGNEKMALVRVAASNTADKIRIGTNFWNCCFSRGGHQRECRILAKKFSKRIMCAVLVGAENAVHAEAFWMNRVPVILIVGDSPRSETEARNLNKYTRYCGLIIYLDEKIKKETFRHSPHAAAIASRIAEEAGPVLPLMESLRGIHQREQSALEFLDKQKALDLSFSYPWFGRDRRRILAEYVTAWRVGIGLRKPSPGFHPGIYAEENGLKEWTTSGDPLVHYSRSGRPSGPWAPVVISPGLFARPRKTNLRSAMQIHLHYIDAAGDIIGRIARSRSTPDLYISTSTEEDSEVLRRQFAKLRGRKVDIRTVPNRGRDLGPLLTEFSRELQGYDVIGHVHTKKSLEYGNRYVIENWVNFLFENMIGGRKPMIDVILNAMEADPRLGLVYPSDPHVIGWMGNMDQATKILASMGLAAALPIKHIDFPVGTMFWARPGALKPLFDLRLNWSDYPQEPILADGTMLHAIERILPIVSDLEGYRKAVTHVRGVLR